MNNSSEKKLKKIFLIKKTMKKPKEEKNIKRVKKKKTYKYLCGKQYLQEKIKYFILNTHLNHKTYHGRIFHTFIFPYKCYIDECTKRI